jgi:3-hydroxyisobutyrate dehydrogenase-like beta-hydroxyacid dehydrogenase
VLESDPDNRPLADALGAAAQLAEKDLSLALAVGRSVGVSMPGTAQTVQQVARLFGIQDPKRR